MVHVEINSFMLLQIRKLKMSKVNKISYEHQELELVE